MKTVRERIYFAIPDARKNDIVPEYMAKYREDLKADEIKWVDLEQSLKLPFGMPCTKVNKKTGERVYLLEFDSASMINGELETLQKESVKEKPVEDNIPDGWIRVIDVDTVIPIEILRTYLPITSDKNPGYTWKMLMDASDSYKADPENSSMYTLEYIETTVGTFMNMPDAIDKLWSDLLIKDEYIDTTIYTSASECREHLDGVTIEDIE